MPTRVFTVSEATWKEHREAGIAAINDPYCSNQTPSAYATRQRVMTEISGIRPGDRIFFYIQRTKELLGGYEARSKPFFDTSLLFPGAEYIDERFPFRLGFKPMREYPRPLHINEIWAGRDAGKIWTMQQARGDVVGRHSCWSLTLYEGNLLDRMFNELNVINVEPRPVKDLPESLVSLPLDFRIDGVRYPHLKYEASLQSILLEGLAEGNWREVFGNYDDFLPYVSTSEGREIDTLLIRHDDTGSVIWYQLLELKSDRFRQADLLQLLAYETWMTSSNQVGGNPRMVHMIALANRFDIDVIQHEKSRRGLHQKPVRLLTYQVDDEFGNISINEIDPTNIQ
jgi:hypothetical protein